MSKILWYTGLSDIVLQKVAIWKQSWPTGKSFATRPLMNNGIVEDVSTKRILPMLWKQEEWAELVRILTEMRPKWLFTEDCKIVLQNIGRCRMVQNNYRVIEFAVYSKDVDELFDVVLEAKQGKSAMQEMLDAPVSSGEDLWKI